MTLTGSAPKTPDDRLVAECSDLIFEPSDTRDRIVGRIFEGCHPDGIETLNRCYAAVTGAAPLMKKLREAGKTPEEALEAGIIGESDMQQINDMQALVDEVVAVDDYSPEDLATLFPNLHQPTARAAE